MYKRKKRGSGVERKKKEEKQEALHKSFQLTTGTHYSNYFQKHIFSFFSVSGKLLHAAISPLDAVPWGLVVFIIISSGDSEHGKGKCRFTKKEQQQQQQRNEYKEVPRHSKCYVTSAFRRPEES
uniref:Uncharacterized protein n=1 Tax=Trypanosoma congolense (strain IL3000) TaxID=1068625 RepID=F9WGS2_TRYCI|nr:hypothetical protein, unlikely [Trypanosoma congolense IL3000]